MRPISSDWDRCWPNRRGLPFRSGTERSAVFFLHALSKSSVERSWERCYERRVARLGGRALNRLATVSLRDSSRTSMLFSRPNQSIKPHAIPELPPQTVHVHKVASL